MANISSTQSALLVTSIGNSLTLTKTHPVPTPSPTQLLLKVSVTSLNPHDQKSRDVGLFIANSLPAILSNDVVGNVVSPGSEAQALGKFKVGDRVLSHAALDGKSLQNGLQQYILADVDFCMPIPDSVSDDQAATLPTNIIAALIAFFDDSGFGIPAPWRDEAKAFDYAHTTVLIVGGGSSCGRFGVQMCSLAGIGKIVVVGGDEEELKGYVATQIISRHGSYEEVLSKVKEIVGDDLLYSFDAVNPPSSQKLAIEALSKTKKGTMVRLVKSLTQTGDVDVSAYDRDFERKWILGSSQVHAELSREFWERVPRWMNDGTIKATHYKSVRSESWEQVEKEVNMVLDGYRDGERVVKTNVHLP